MAQIWQDGFDHYGGIVSNLLLGPYAEEVGGMSLEDPSFGARTGTYALRNSGTSNDNWVRRVLGAAFTTVFAGFGYRLNEIPSGSNDMFPVRLTSVGNADIITVTVRADGGLILRSGDESGAVLAETTGPVLVAGTWHHIEIGTTRDAAAGTFEIRVDEVVVMDASGLALGADDYGQIVLNGSRIPGSTDSWVDDVVVRNDVGAVNNDFQGDLRVATLQPIANGVNQGWATRSIQKLSTGVMSFLDSDNDMGIAYADNAAFELGTGDFCMEGFVRFDETVGDDTIAVLFSKWRESTDERSWRIAVEGANISGNIVFATSTDGTSGDVVEVIAFPFVPITDRWYHIAVARESAVTRMFLDGEQIDIDQADARDYDANTAALFVNGSQSTNTTTIDDESLDGWMDGVRLTVGVARYTANFAVPTDALPNTVGGDPLYNSVELLLNFDSDTNSDESTNAFVGTLMNAPDVIFPADSSAYQTIDSLDPDDNNFVEADLVAATGTLTLTGQPLNTETVTLGATTYTFLTVLVDVADNVLIGATEADSLLNLQAAVNLEAGAGTLYGTGTVLNASAFLTPLPSDEALATARTAGTVGNTVASTETLTNGAWSAATLLGGLDIPTNSEFTVSALPPEVTGVRSVSIVSRSFKTDAGASSMQMSFVNSGGTADAGADRPMTLSPTYYEDMFDEIPGGGNWTPTELVDARIRLNRTL